MLSIVAKVENLEVLKRVVFQETTTLGIRISKALRFVLKRELKEVELPYGKVKVKVSTGPDGVVNIIPEYEDCKRIAMETGWPLKDIIELAKRAYNDG